MRQFLTFWFLLINALANNAQSAEIEFSQRFTLDGVFSMPESAVIDENSEYIFISNVNVYAKDGNGFVSRVRVDGSDLQLQWLEGLDSPTGLAIRGNTMFLADYDHLVEVDLQTAQIIDRYPAPDVDPVLNDVAIADDGNVFVSGSGSSTIYHLNNGSLDVWLHDAQRLLFANGLLVRESQILHGGKSWTVFDRSSKQATETLSSINASLADIDGITTDHCGGLILTTVSSGDLWLVDASGVVQSSALGYIDGIDLHRRGNLLAVPRVGNTLSVYHISQNC